MAMEITTGIYSIIFGIFVIVVSTKIASLFRALGSPYPEWINQVTFIFFGVLSIIYGIKSIIGILSK